MVRKMTQNMKTGGIEWIGDIPVEWNVSKIKYLFSIVSGSTPDSDNEEYWDGDIPWITPADMSDFGVINRGERCITKKGYNASGTTLLPLNSIVLSTRAPIGKINITESVLCTNQGCKSLVNTRINTRYYYYLLFTGQEELIKQGSGTTFLELGTMDLGSIWIILPPLPDQQAIASFLDAQCEKIDDIITAMEQQIKVLKQYKTSLITETVTKGLDKSVPMKDSGIDWIGKIPAHWEIKRLKYILKTPLQYGATETGDDYDVSLPRYIRITDISLDNELKNEDKLSLPLDAAKPYLLKDGDILFARSGATVGKSFIFNKKYGQAAFAGYLIRAVCDIEKYFPKYIYYITLGTGYEQWLQMVFTQATIQNIGANRYENLIITSPPPAEQQAIASFLDDKCKSIDRILSDKQTSIETMKSYKKSLIYEYVTGKKRVKI
jgi:type I restriction enzyme S subunit